MSNLANGPGSQDNDQLMAVDTPTIDLNIAAGKWQDVDIEDEYSDFAEDPEELEIIDRLLLEVATSRAQAVAPAPLVVTDIEDYEAPRALKRDRAKNETTTMNYHLREKEKQKEMVKVSRIPQIQIHEAY
ncbi:hypothetical protein HRR83_003840 [Exophiala dermatitidis]|nr:hypothetical protein HRR77_003878 [Exophiala dermatitidis]KAJ4575285.1 hypothetical protein HRR79_002212 [Exophiala dermatitidis]KAJ4599089.1 hypothetical protein HRR83_003840 [Exophiala dermatitidis]